MKNNILILLASVLLIPIQGIAQNGDSEGSGFSAGGGLFYGFEAEQAGVRLDGVYTFTEEARAAIDFGLYFPETTDFVKVNRFEFNVNGHYIFLIKEEIQVYGLAGINYFRFSSELTGVPNLPGTDFFMQASPIDGGTPVAQHQITSNFSSSSNISSSETGLNLGIGGEYDVNFGVIFGELRYSGIGGNADQLVFGAGVRISI